MCLIILIITWRRRWGALDKFWILVYNSRFWARDLTSIFLWLTIIITYLLLLHCFILPLKLRGIKWVFIFHNLCCLSSPSTQDQEIYSLKIIYFYFVFTFLRNTKLLTIFTLEPLPCIQIEDDLNFFMNGRWPQFFINGRQH